MNIAISGHRPDSFLVSHYRIQTIERLIDDTLWRLKKEYEHDLCLNLGGALGIDLWVGKVCIENDIKFNIYLPFHPSVFTKYWKEDQRSELDNQLSKAKKITIIEPQVMEFSYDKYSKRNEMMIDEASFLIAFWVGKRKGGTFNAMKYALKCSKFVFNGLNELKPIFKEDIKIGWTPPTVNNELE